MSPYSDIDIIGGMASMGLEIEQWFIFILIYFINIRM